MDSINRILLDRVQRSFPLVSKPYEALSEGLDIDGDDVRERIGLLKDQKLLRQISAIFNTGALGYQSSLIAMAVPESALEHAVAVINNYPGVSHNYLRPGSYNIWYTIAVPPGESLEEIVERLSLEAGGWPTLILPALRKYKLAVVLDVLGEGDGDPGEERLDLPVLESSVSFQPSPGNIGVVRCIQEDLPLIEKPFHAWADDLRMKEEDLLDLMSDWIKKGYMRRFAAILNHRQVGFNANGMVVWDCPEGRLDEIGLILATQSEVSHCYYRPGYPDWPYNLYAMVHGRSVDDCQKIAAKLGRVVQLPDYRILFSTREFKKIRLKLFWG